MNDEMNRMVNDLSAAEHLTRAALINMRSSLHVARKAARKSFITNRYETALDVMREYQAVTGRTNNDCARWINKRIKNKES